jgi:hypothetical protein
MKIDFEFNTSYGVYRDALHLDDNHNLSDEQIEAIKQERLANWISVIENPPQEEPEVEYVEIDGVRYQKVDQ